MSVIPSSAREGLGLRRDELLRRLSRVQRDLQNADSAPDPDWPDRAIQRENDEVLMELEIRTTDELLQVQHAIERAAANRYGECEVCGQAIEPPRLAAVPDATTCSACVQQRTAA